MEKVFTSNRLGKSQEYGLRRVVLIILTILVLLSLVFAATSTINSFNDQSNPFNVSLTGGVNDTQYIRLPRYVYAQNITITIEGIEIS